VRYCHSLCYCVHMSNWKIWILSVIPRICVERWYRRLVHRTWYEYHPGSYQYKHITCTNIKYRNIDIILKRSCYNRNGSAFYKETKIISKELLTSLLLLPSMIWRVNSKLTLQTTWIAFSSDTYVRGYLHVFTTYVVIVTLDAVYIAIEWYLASTCGRDCMTR
jgi:hypothetical protein